jgi:hypothetical protein
MDADRLILGRYEKSHSGISICEYLIRVSLSDKRRVSFFQRSALMLYYLTAYSDIFRLELVCHAEFVCGITREWAIAMVRTALFFR